MTAVIDSRELGDLDTMPPFANPDADTAPWACEVCNAPVPPTPSGRKPRLMRCDEHRKTSSGKNAPRSAGGSGKHARVHEGMMAIHGMVAMGVGLVSLPTHDDVWIRDKDIIADNADSLSEAWAKATDVNPKLQKAVLQFLDMAGSLTLIGAYAPVAFAITMNHKNTAAQKAAAGPVHEGVMS